MTPLPESLQLPARSRAQGTVALPGSKSISNRVLLLSALATGNTDVVGLLDSDDTRVMLQALARLGVKIEPAGEGVVRVEGTGGEFPVRQADLFLGNAGTAFRPLTAALAMMSDAGCEYRLAGVPRMHERPIGDLVDALRRAGCAVRYLETEGYPPLAIGANVRRGSIDAGPVVPIRGSVSSQFLSAFLMAMHLANPAPGVEVVGELISKPYVDITVNLMARFGVELLRDGARFACPQGAHYVSPGRIQVEGDASSASYFLAAGALAGGPVRVTGVGHASIQGDVQFAGALRQMGAQVTLGEDWIEAAPPAGAALKGITLDCNHIPDAAMTLAVLALFATGATTLTHIASWRVKETDRLAAMATELRKFGATVDEGVDFLRIVPPSQPVTPGTGIDTYDDHRIAMCFSLPSLRGIPVTINDPKCVAKTFPAYFDVFRGIAA
ncbi:MAG: 3-phosphoshikimate 1-carboxyvinyltransferase [Betaproteobacteria bacterium]|nr:3-phosphoshikimate 1-carboxyvinyltransferase [Betaproteobacteria bacterium]